ncbi:hypothetical protein BaRGS_00013303 [Batillaria attramentaria]|uniref:Uncharacterized protein n=1 Tax=Batillaria attramentaria TaxID=370345 RepID=A0ABD0L7N3_9CAEN
MRLPVLTIGAETNTKVPQARDTTKSNVPSEGNDGVHTTDIWSGTGAIVIACVSIVAVAATVITITLVFAKRGQKTHDSQPDPQADNIDGESVGRPATPPYHQYWEIQDEFLPPIPELPAVPHAAAEAVPDQGYLTPVPTPKATRDAPSCSPRAQQALPDDGYLTPAPSRKATADTDENRAAALLPPEDCSESYERPVNPDYTTPNPPYEPLRSLYETVRQ